MRLVTCRQQILTGNVDQFQSNAKICGTGKDDLHVLEWGRKSDKTTVTESRVSFVLCGQRKYSLLRQELVPSRSSQQSHVQVM